MLCVTLSALMILLEGQKIILSKEAYLKREKASIDQMKKIDKEIEAIKYNIKINCK